MKESFMKKIYSGAFILLIILLFAACPEDSGPSMNEVYAGDWYGYWGSDWIKLELTDTTFKSSYWNGSSYIPDSKGKVEKTGEGSVIITVTHYYDSGWVDMDDESFSGTYDVSADGTELTMYGTPDGTIYLDSTDS